NPDPLRCGPRLPRAEHAWLLALCHGLCRWRGGGYPGAHRLRLPGGAGGGTARGTLTRRRISQVGLPLGGGRCGCEPSAHQAVAESTWSTLCLSEPAPPLEPVSPQYLCLPLQWRYAS
ncbi:unnamed protein product, partial [Symbiodinium necroappetens]